MNSYLANLYGNSHEKTASEFEVDLSEISAADFLAAANEGLVDVSDFINTDSEKVAEDQEPLDFSGYSEGQLIDALNEIKAQEENTEFSEFSNGELVDALNSVNDQQREKVASGDIDLNALTVEEFVNFGHAIEGVIGNFQKEAAANSASNWIERYINHMESRQ